MRLGFLALLGVAGALALLSCSSDSGNPVVDATGTVLVGAYVDMNANGKLDTNLDANAAGVRVTLSPWGGGAAVRTGTTGAGGIVILPVIPVGRYRIDVDSLSVGDTLQATLATTDITVSANDTVAVLIPLTYPRRTVAQARQLAPGRRVLVQAIALTGAATFPDTTGQVADSTGTVRLVHLLTGGYQTGDTVRVLATRDSRDGQPVLTDARVYSVTSGIPPTARTVTAATAASAAGGTLDAALVRVTGARILSVQVLATSDRVLTVSDTTGTLQVFVDRTTGPIADPLVVGALLDATGVLVPVPGGSGWRLRPRAGSDIAAQFPTVTTAQARLLEPGRPVAMIGVALNGSASFGDNSVHLADAAGALRALPVSPTVFTGDSIRLVGTIAIQNGQTILGNVTASVFGPGHVPAPFDLTTADAATAVGGLRDAALVRVRGATIADTARSSGDFLMTVNDGSGKLRVILDRDAWSWVTAGYVPGAALDLTGLLVPESSGTSWALKPRVGGDVVVR